VYAINAGAVRIAPTTRLYLKKLVNECWRILAMSAKVFEFSVNFHASRSEFRPLIGQGYGSNRRRAGRVSVQ
jgi:hypothetical protein